MDKQIKQGWSKFVALCGDAKSPQELDKLLKFFLTIAEQEQIATRVLLTKELMDDHMTQRELAQQLKISIAKITRGSNYIKATDEKFKQYLATALLGKNQNRK